MPGVIAQFHLYFDDLFPKSLGTPDRGLVQDMTRIIAFAAAACLIGQAAFAHAFLDRASPAVGSEVSGSPPALS